MNKSTQNKIKKMATSAAQDLSFQLHTRMCADLAQAQLLYLEEFRAELNYLIEIKMQLIQEDIQEANK